MRIPIERIWAEHPVAQRIVAELEAAGHLAVLVGGVVRDALLAQFAGQEFHPKDLDLATSAPPEEVRRLFSRHYKVLTVGEAFGVVVVVGPDGRQYEVATFRAEGEYADGRRPRRVQWASLEEDLRRRDFTVNGLAATKDGEVLDLVGGIADLRAGLIRTIGDPHARLGEDYLRMLRAVRFACQLGFRLEEGTAAAIRAHAPKILSISWDRIREELVRILSTPRSAEGLRLLGELGLLVHLLPEVAALQGVPQDPAYHPEGDVFAHTLLALAQADGIWDDPLLKMALLLHDVGKPRALARSGGENMAGHCLIGAGMAEEVLARLRFSRREIERVRFLVAEHMRVARLPEMGLGKQVRLLCTGEDEGAPLAAVPQRFPLFADLLRLVICDAEATAHRSAAWLPVLAQTVRLLVHLRRVQGLKRARELLSGHDLLALGEPPGPRLGRILEEVHERILAGEIATREEALAEARRLIREENLNSLTKGANRV
ncbi:MAG: CCA tRNA nucleotidyltransferase [Candidatus Bipolaricaulaceae bacterium]